MPPEACLDVRAVLEVKRVSAPVKASLVSAKPKPATPTPTPKKKAAAEPAMNPSGCQRSFAPPLSPASCATRHRERGFQVARVGLETNECKRPKHDLFAADTPDICVERNVLTGIVDRWQ